MITRPIVQKFQLLLITVVVLVVSLANGCSSGPTKVESDLGLKGVPDWVNEGTATLKTKDGRLFHGVGSAKPMDDLSFQTSVADNRARAEIARILTSYMEVVSRDYVALQSAHEQGYTQANASREINNVTKVNLSGARIIGHWRDKKSGIVYSIAELDMEQVKQTLDQVSAMNEGLKGYFQTEGDNIFDRIVEGRD
jgi:hypothetical protein